MTSEELHTYLMELKNKNVQSPDIVTYKETIREALDQYRTTIPRTNLMLNEQGGVNKNVVFYSFMEAPNKPAIGDHELKRMRISWRSLRKFNKDIEVRFCYDGDDVRWTELCDEFDIKMYGFSDTFKGTEPNAWCIHRWYNMSQWADEDLNLLYMDADTYCHGDIGLLFDIYKRDPVYGREELGFRHDPNLGCAGEDPRFYLDLLDAAIMSQGGKTEVQKYCLGVILLNQSVHKLFTPEVMEYYTDLLERIRTFKVFYSIPNYRIMDEFAFWILMSRWSIRTSLFGDQDVSQTFLEKKHENHFNPIVLHYTTYAEEKFADWAPEFYCLSRSLEEREFADVAAGGIYNVTPLMREELAMSMW